MYKWKFQWLNDHGVMQTNTHTLSTFTKEVAMHWFSTDEAAKQKFQLTPTSKLISCWITQN